MSRRNYLTALILAFSFGGINLAPTLCDIPGSSEKGNCVISCPNVHFSTTLVTFPDAFEDYTNRKLACDSIFPNSLCCETSTLDVLVPSTTIAPVTAAASSPLNIIEDKFLPSIRGNKNLKLFDLLTCGHSNLKRVAFGQNADLLEHPWAVRMGYISNDSPTGRISFNCGGSLISVYYVLTAAHCIITPGYTLKRVRLGEYDGTTDPDCDENNVCAGPFQDVEVAKVIPHPNYKFSKGVAIINDIALVRLSQPAKLKQNNIKTICLPLQQNSQKIGKNYIVIGWGKTQNQTSSTILQRGFLPPVNASDCKEMYAQKGFTIHESQMCAGGKDKVDSCGGDSGGALLAPGLINDIPRTVQYGVVSLGLSTCGKESFPGLYTNVSDYLNWILDNMY